MSYQHRRDPLSWDFDGGWDGRVVMTSRGFVRYLDRNGDRSHAFADLPDGVVAVPTASVRSRRRLSGRLRGPASHRQRG